MLIYLDTCCLQRPLDDKTQVRVQLESEAILAVLNLVEDGKIDLVSSEVLEIEVGQNPHPHRRAYVEEILAKAERVVFVSESVIYRAKQLESLGFNGMDSLHISSAEHANVDFFCSCDDRLLRRARALNDGLMKIVSPFELVEEII